VQGVGLWGQLLSPAVENAMQLDLCHSAGLSDRGGDVCLAPSLEMAARNEIEELVGLLPSPSTPLAFAFPHLFSSFLASLTPLSALI
jgi:hypothetical protein